MNLSPPYFDHKATIAPYIVTMQVQTTHLRALTVGAAQSKASPLATEMPATLPDQQQPITQIATHQPTHQNQSSATASKQKKKSTYTPRENAEWVSALADNNDPERQRAAHEELGNYLYIVAYNYLQKRTNDIQRLNKYQTEELAELAKDFVQSAFLKLVKDEYALLDKYSGTGRFTSWAAQVTTNLIASELRKTYWQKYFMPDDGLQVSWVEDEAKLTPHNRVELEEMVGTVAHLLDQLPKEHQRVLLGCVGGGERAADVAKELGITPNALYLIAHRAKAKMRKLLEKEGINANSLEIFNSS